MLHVPFPLVPIQSCFFFFYFNFWHSLFHLYTSPVVNISAQVYFSVDELLFETSYYYIQTDVNYTKMSVSHCLRYQDKYWLLSSFLTVSVLVFLCFLVIFHFCVTCYCFNAIIVYYYIVMPFNKLEFKYFQFFCHVCVCQIFIDTLKWVPLIPRQLA